MVDGRTLYRIWYGEQPYRLIVERLANEHKIEWYHSEPHLLVTSDHGRSRNSTTDTVEASKGNDAAREHTAAYSQSHESEPRGAGRVALVDCVRERPQCTLYSS